MCLPVLNEYFCLLFFFYDYNDYFAFQVIIYLRQCLSASAEAEMIAGKDASPSTFLSQSPLISRYVNKQLDISGERKGPVYMYINLIQQLLTAESGGCLLYLFFLIFHNFSKKHFKLRYFGYVFIYENRSVSL